MRHLRLIARSMVKRHLDPLFPFHLTWVKRSRTSFLCSALPSDKFLPPPSPFSRTIERRCALTQQLGSIELWGHYERTNARVTQFRTSEDVRTFPRDGNFFAWLIRRCKPDTVVEFGTAFGVSGMYWLAGIEQAGKGHLFTFEPNHKWLDIARANLKAVSDRFTAVHGTFEDMADQTLIRRVIDIAFIDAIHTSAFVLPQLDMVLARSRPGSIIVLDDIAFSDDMRDCWQRVAGDVRVRSSLSVGRRFGVIEVG